MKIKRVFADDMRSAMRQVRESHGADAVILSSRRVEGGVEVISAVDYDEQAVRAAMAESDGSAKQTTAEGAGAANGEPGGFSRLLASADAAASRETSPARAGGFSVTVGDDSERASEDGEKPTPGPPSDGAPSLSLKPGRLGEEVNEPAMQAMRKELRTLRSLFENQITLMEWRQASRTTPTRTTLMRRLHAMGFGADVCRGLTDAVPTRAADPDHAVREALSLVRKRLAISDTEISEHGGAVALVGPTGVGKTTTVAKLAARFALHHGRNEVVLVTTDNFRIGGQEQLRHFARILGVPVHAAVDGEELGRLLDDFADRRLVLIDTAGMSQRDLRLAEEMRTLKEGVHRIRPWLVLSANTQLAALTETLRAFRVAAPEACVVSKIDEAASLGGVLTAVMRGRLPIAYLADGQRVPEDLHLARAEALLEKTESLAARHEEESDETLAVAFGGSAAQRV